MDNLQEIFDVSTSHLLKQGVPSVNDHGSCKYRFYLDGITLMCAAGPFVTSGEADNQYNTSFDVVTEYWVRNFSREEADFISELQDQHDSWVTKTDWFDRWIVGVSKLASRYGLNTDVIDKWKEDNDYDTVD